jgi:hypothetical protein
MTRAPVSLCMIVRDEPNIDLRGIEAYVEEIVMVDTGTEVPCSAATHRFTECNNPNTGEIEDFSMARNYSFSFATQPFAMWIDGDDSVVGGEHLAAICEEQAGKFTPRMIVMPYEYAHDGAGVCIEIFDRERLVTPVFSFRWERPVHETLVANATCHAKRDDRVTIVHRGERKAKPEKRNLRILLRADQSNHRIVFDLAKEYTHANMLDEAVATLDRYFGMVIGGAEWYAARCLSAQIMMARGRWEEAIDEARTAVDVHPTFTLGKMILAEAHIEDGDPINARFWAKEALTSGDKAELFRRPKAMDRMREMVDAEE